MSKDWIVWLKKGNKDNLKKIFGNYAYTLSKVC